MTWYIIVWMDARNSREWCKDTYIAWDDTEDLADPDSLVDALEKAHELASMIYTDPQDKSKVYTSPCRILLTRDFEEFCEHTKAFFCEKK